MSRKFFIITLGCKVNQYESRSLSESWQEQGWLPVENPAAADIILVNTCAVTSKAVADARAAVRKLRREAPQAEVWLTGCAAEASGEELAGLEGVHGIRGQSRKPELLRLPETLPNNSTVFSPSLQEETEPSSPVPLAGKNFPEFRISGYDRSRPVIKVQDGCSHRCTYCIVPLTRGPARSRLPEDIRAEAERLLAAGFRELTLNGINLRQYGHKTTTRREDFWDLVEYLEQALAPTWADKARLRISSLDPAQLDTRSLRIFSSSSMIAPQLHLSLQSGSPSVLQRMGRGHYAPEDIATFLKSLAAKRPLFGLGADILTGFPGETEEEFQETLAFCQSLPLTYAHVFPYSRRPGTQAAKMPGHLPQEEKKRRAALLRTTVEEKRLPFLKQLLQLPRLHVVFEEPPQLLGQQTTASPEGTSTKTAGKQAPLGSKHRMRAQNQGPRGVCEFYADCRMETGPLAVAYKELTPVEPVGIDAGVLLVRPIESATATIPPAQTEESS